MLKTLGKSIREYKWVSILTPILVLTETYFETFITYKMADLIDLGVETGNLEVVKSIGGQLLWLALLCVICGAASGILASIAGSGFATNLRKDMYYKVMHFSFENVDKFSTAGIVTRMTTDVTSLQMAYMMSVRMLFRIPGSLVFALIMSFKTNKNLAMVFLIVIPILAFGLIFIMKNAMPLFKKMFKVFDRMNQTIQENVRGMRVVKAFVREDFEKQKFSDVATENMDLSIKAEKVIAWNGPLMTFCVYLCSLLLCWFGAKHIVSGGMTTGQLTSIMSYVLMILSSLMILSFVFIIASRSIESGKRVCEILNEVPAIQNCENPKTNVADGSIKFENVSFAYADSKDCLSNINFEIQSGETIGIIGGTGTGKTSLVQLIPRLYDAGSGKVSVGGVDVKEYDITSLRKAVAMVLQKNILFSGTVRSNLLWGNENATDDDIWESLKLAQAADFVRDKLGEKLDSRIEQGGANVSGGQRQRLCIARALMSHPKILILDDSTSAVDTATEKRIREGFASFIPETTKIIISQRISSVKDADRIIVLDDGKISGIGTHEELLKNNRIYKEVFDSQNKGGDFDEPEAD